MKFVGLVAVFCLMTSPSLAKKPEKSERKSSAVQTINTFKSKAGSIAFTCTPSNCREQQDGSYLFNLSCQTNKEGDKLELYLGEKSQTIQAFGFVDLPGDLTAPKKGSVPISLSASEEEGSPRTTFSWKYTVEQVKKSSCRKYGDIEL